MYKKLPIIILFITGFIQAGTAQTQFWFDNFEDSGLPSSGSRTTSIAEFISCTSPVLSYFKRVTNTEISPISFSNFSGSKFWAGMDIDKGPACGANNTISAGQSITWTGINIAGKGGLTFRGFFGANSVATFQGLPFLPAADTMSVAYRIDGGAWIKIVGVHCNDNTTAGGPLGFDLNGDRIGDGGIYTLSNSMSEITANIPGTGTTLDLRFNIFVNNQQVGALAFDNFRLFNSTTLPVSLASFTARKQDELVALSWSTASEQNSKNFIIQQKTETGTWNDIGVVAASGNSASLRNYNYLHRTPARGVNYYRIAQTDLDGKTSFSEVKLVSFTPSPETFVILENPISNGVLKVQVNKPTDLFLYDMEGRLIWQKRQVNGLMAIPVKMYSRGVYTLKSKEGNRKVVVQ